MCLGYALVASYQTIVIFFYYLGPQLERWDLDSSVAETMVISPLRNICNRRSMILFSDNGPKRSPKLAIRRVVRFSRLRAMSRTSSQFRRSVASLLRLNSRMSCKSRRSVATRNFTIAFAGPQSSEKNGRNYLVCTSVAQSIRE